MGAIADAAVRVLVEGPCSTSHLGRRLAADGVTRARNPDRAVRRALRGDPRVIEIGYGRVAMREHVLAGLTLTRYVAAHEAVDGHVEVDDDLSPITGADAPQVMRLPGGTPAYAVVALRVTDALGGITALARISMPPARPGDERLLIDALGHGIAAVRGDRLPVVRLRDALLTVAAFHADAFRVPGRPLSTALAEAGLEAHLGWVGHAGTDWDALDEVESVLLSREVADLASRGHLPRAIERQRRLVRLNDTRGPGDAHACRHRLAGLLDRAGRPMDAIGVLASLARMGDPEAYYAMAVTHLGAGDEVAARRAVEEGLARSSAPGQRLVRECLADLASQLDGEAALQRFASRTPGPAGWMRAPVPFATSVVGVGRAHLVECILEEVGSLMCEPDLMRLLHVVAAARAPACDDLLAVAAVVLEGPAALVAARYARSRRVTSPAARVLSRPMAAAAWSTAPRDAPGQQQIILAVAREGGRLAPLVALIEHHDAGETLKDAFFLPDMVPARLWREILVPMADAGIAPRPLRTCAALQAVRAAADATRARGSTIPSQQHQPVMRRIHRLCDSPHGPSGPGAKGGWAVVG
jgi:hypothetical protein